MTEYGRTITLADLWLVFRKCWIIMLVAGIVIGAITFAYAYMSYTEIYTAQSSLVVIRKGGTTSPGSYGTGDYSVDLYMVNDVAEMLKRPSFLAAVVEDLEQNPEFGGKVSASSLARDIKIETFEDTRFVCFTNTAGTEKDASLIGQTICRLAKDKILEVFDVDRVSIVDNGFTKGTPSNGKIGMMHLVIPVAAAFAVYAVFMVLHLFDDKIKTPEDVEKHLGLTVLGMIPNIDAAGKVKSRYYSAYYAKYGKYSEYGSSASNK